jgi:hypothetical protein
LLRRGEWAVLGQHELDEDEWWKSWKKEELALARRFWLVAKVPPGKW